MGGAFERRTGIRRKKTGRKINVRGFCYSGLILLGSDLISRHTGVAAAQTPRRALLIHALGPIRALAVGGNSPAVHLRNWRH